MPWSTVIDLLPVMFVVGLNWDALIRYGVLCFHKRTSWNKIKTMPYHAMPWCLPGRTITRHHTLSLTWTWIISWLLTTTPHHFKGDKEGVVMDIPLSSIYAPKKSNITSMVHTHGDVRSRIHWQEMRLFFHIVPSFAEHVSNVATSIGHGICSIS